MVKEKKPACGDQSSVEDFLGSEPECQRTEDPKPEPSRQESQVTDDDPPARQKPIASAPLAEDEIESEEEKYAEAVEQPEVETAEETEVVVEIKVGDRDTPRDLPPSFLLSIDYAGQQKKAVARLYESNSKQLFFWFDNRGHLPYCYTDLPRQAVNRMDRVGKSPGFVRTESVQMLDLLQDQPRDMTKVIADDPLSIGGRPGSIREQLVKDGVSHAWEANIRYRNCYTYDTRVVPGLVYKIENSDLIPCPPKMDSKLIDEYKRIVQDEKGLDAMISEYAPMFFTEVPDIKRVAVDIEVYTPVKNRVPDAATARYEIIAISFSDNEGYSKCFLLNRKDHPEGTKDKDFPAKLDVVPFDREVDMLMEAFKMIDTYPIVLTFVGDAFDLNYMYHRAERLGIDVKRQCPITLGKDVALLKRGIHVDLYRFLKNPSIRLYALSGAYEQNNLDSVAKGLLGVGKSA